MIGERSQAGPPGQIPPLIARVRKFAVPQRRQVTGCIPTGYEMLIRESGIEGVALSTFQEDFDLAVNGVGPNNFQSVGNAVRAAYPQVHPEVEIFSSGREKAARLDELIDQNRLVLVSLPSPKGWHIVPVFERSGDEYKLLWIMRPDGFLDINVLSRDRLIRYHDTLSGGNDIAWLSP